MDVLHSESLTLFVRRFGMEQVDVSGGQHPMR